MLVCDELSDVKVPVKLLLGFLEKLRSLHSLLSSVA